MSDAFPMPQTIGAPGAAANAFPPKPSDYAPKRGLAAVAEAVAQDPPPYTAQPNGKQPYAAPKHVDTIKEALKRLTHREMRELTAAIFAAAAGDTIAKNDLPDVLDKFAYGD